MVKAHFKVLWRLTWFVWDSAICLLLKVYFPRKLFGWPQDKYRYYNTGFRGFPVAFMTVSQMKDFWYLKAPPKSLAGLLQTF